MGSSLLDVRELTVNQQRIFPAVTVGFDVLDASGVVLGSFVQVGRDNLDKTLHPRADDATTALGAKLGVAPNRAYLLTPFELRSSTGDVVLHVILSNDTKKRLFVCEPDNTEIGRICRENLFGKPRLSLEIAGVKAGAITVSDRRRKSWVVSDAAQRETGRIEMTQGSSGDFTDVNNYAVHLASDLGAAVRWLTLASVFAIDLILWQRHG